MALTIDIPQGWSLVMGKKALRAVLRGAGNEIAANARRMIRSGGGTKKRAAKRASMPGGPPVGRTGNLARNIKVRLWKNGEGVSIKDIARSPRGSGAPYALFLEKGSQGGVGSGRKGVKGRHNQWKRINRKNVRIAVVGHRVVAAHPFMYPALDQALRGGLMERVREAAISGMKFARGARPD